MSSKKKTNESDSSFGKWKIPKNVRVKDNGVIEGEDTNTLDIHERSEKELEDTAEAIIRLLRHI